MRLKLRRCYGAVLVSLALGLTACGGGSQRDGAVVVRVGADTITKAMIDRWAAIVERGGGFTGFRGVRDGGTGRQRALVLLISSDWLIGEAERERLVISDHAVEEALAERMRGEAAREFAEMRKVTGQTLTGVELEVRAEMALEAIRRLLARRASRITRPEAEVFYRRHRRDWASPEARVIDIAENLPSAAAATALIRRVGSGREFAKVALHKNIRYTASLLVGSELKREVDKAIFTARPGVVSRPMRLPEGWAVFVVRRIAPGRVPSLMKVWGEVIEKLKQQRKEQIAGIFAREYARRWIGSTSCDRGYVVPGCAEYGGRLGLYENPFLSP